MKRLLILLVVIALACGGGEKSAPSATKAGAPPVRKSPPLPAAAEAATLLEGSSELGEYQFTSAAVTIPMKRSQMNAPQRENAGQLEKAGWLTFHGDDVVLTKGKDDPRFNVRGNGFVDIVPVAKKKMGAVTAVRPSKDGCEADFTWSWIPTEVGTAFVRGPVKEMFDKPRTATATFISDGTKWTVLGIREAAR